MDDTDVPAIVNPNKLDKDIAAIIIIVIKAILLMVFITCPPQL